MFDNSNWDSTEFYRGYQAAINDIHHPDTNRCQFKVRQKDGYGHGIAYAIRKDGDNTFFLICKHGRWEWENVDKFVPYED